MNGNSRIIVISCVKNEEDIIESFLRHHLALVDGMVILDNGSTDRTASIIRDVIDEGVGVSRNVIILHDPYPAYKQSERMTTLLHACAMAELRADWVIPLDADEFVPRDVIQRLRHGQVPTDSVATLTWRNYLPTDFDDRSITNPVQRLLHRRSYEPRTRYKVMIPALFVTASEGRISIAMGNHSVSKDGVVVKPYVDESCVLTHFPIRHPQQFAVKIMHQVVGFDAMASRNPAWGSHMSGAFQLLEQDPQEFFERFTELAQAFDSGAETTGDAAFVRDPVVYCGGPLLFTKEMSPHYALASAIRYSRALARALAEKERAACHG